MTDLSSAAPAVLTASAKARCFREWDSVNDPPCHPNDAHRNGCHQCVDRGGVAAALRAAADQVVPLHICGTNATRAQTRLGIRHKLLAIADELENLQ